MNIYKYHFKPSGFSICSFLQIQNLNVVSYQNWAATLIMTYKYAEYEYVTKNYIF